jgi:hypothetical protein
MLLPYEVGRIGSLTIRDGWKQTFTRLDLNEKIRKYAYN